MSTWSNPTSSAAALSALEPLLAAVQSLQATDLFLHEGQVPRVRLAGGILPLEHEPVDTALFDALWSACGLGPEATDGDAAWSDATGARYRVSLLRQVGQRAAVFRHISATPPRLEDLGLPTEILCGWIERRSGLVLICGPTGSGKSTTVAGLLAWINARQAKHIITLEDPVEMLFAPGLSVITQREIGLDTPCFAHGLRQALRQSPDVIFVGEIRDRATAEMALQASETGHLVMSTLHVGRAAEAITRLRLLFSAEEREFLGAVLARELTGVLCQRLVPTLDGRWVVAAEYFANEGNFPQLLMAGRSEEIADLVARSRTQQSQNFSTALWALIQSGQLDEATALRHAPDPSELQRRLRGVM